MSKDYVPQTPAVVSTPKHGLNEHKFELPGRMRGGSIIELEMLELGEKRWRLRTPSGNEARITEATLPHTQETRNRKMPGLYIMKRGWVASFTVVTSLLPPIVEMAFAGTPKFYIEIPEGCDYVVRFSEMAVFKYESPEEISSSPVKDELYLKVSSYTEDEILSLYAKRHKLSLEAVRTSVSTSLKIKK